MPPLAAVLSMKTSGHVLFVWCSGPGLGGYVTCGRVGLPTPTGDVRLRGAGLVVRYVAADVFYPVGPVGGACPAAWSRPNSGRSQGWSPEHVTGVWRRWPSTGRRAIVEGVSCRDLATRSWAMSEGLGFACRWMAYVDLDPTRACAQRAESRRPRDIGLAVLTYASH